MTKVLLLVAAMLSTNALSQSPMGAPGIVPNWSVAKKVQVGTTNNKNSLVWFTNAQGVLTESYYPTIDKAQIKDAQLLVSDGATFLIEERTQTQQTVEILSANLVKLINRDYLNRFQIEHIFYTHENKAIIIDEVKIKMFVDGLDVYALVNPALNNTGFKDSGLVKANQLSFKEENLSLLVDASVGFSKASVGYVGFSDGFQDLASDFKMDFNFTQALDGNVAGLGKVNLPSKKGEYTFYLTYSFEKANSSISSKELAAQKLKYDSDWNKYYDSIKKPLKLTKQEQELYYRSLYVLKVHEDKLNPGALIASLSKPWGDTTYEQPGVQVGGYHMVWPRDLYHVCTAMINAGDLDTAKRALRFLKRIQYQDGNWFYGERTIPRKGAFPQNTWVTTQEYWGGLQLDQVAYPVHIFYQLWQRANSVEKSKLLQEFGQMMKLALDFIENYGPWSAQERWEENYGISPSTFSAAASALMMGHKVFQKTSYLTTAQGWLTKPNDNIHTWTFTNKGHFDDGQYYIRVGGCSSFLAQWDPNNGHHCHVANSWSSVEQTKMVDQGFLKLALLGLMPSSDWRIKKSKAVVDNHIKVKTPNGGAWYRYSYDAYGEDKKGRLWPLLSGEHGRYAIERFFDGDLDWSSAEAKVNEILNSYIGFANSGAMLPEQVWEHTGEGTGAATPLAWSHAEYVKLLWSRNDKKNVENLLE